MQTSPDLGTVFPLSSQASHGLCWQRTWKWGNWILCPHCSNLLGLGHRCSMCFLCSWATFLTLQPGGLIGEMRQDRGFSSFLRKDTPESPVCDFLRNILSRCRDLAALEPWGGNTSSAAWTCYLGQLQGRWNMNQKRSWKRRKVTDSTLTCPANAGFFSASAAEA